MTMVVNSFRIYSRCLSSNIQVEDFKNKNKKGQGSSCLCVFIGKKKLLISDFTADDGV